MSYIEGRIMQNFNEHLVEYNVLIYIVTGKQCQCQQVELAGLWQTFLGL